MTLTISQSSFDEVVEVPLKSGGEDIPVTSDNKNEYVKLYVEYVLFKTQFDAFKKGFLKVVSARVLLSYTRVEGIGGCELRLEPAGGAGQYKEGYSKDDVIIKNSWNSVMKIKRSFFCSLLAVIVFL